MFFLTSLAVLLSCIQPCMAYTRYADDSCQLIGDTDVYGIGVRISYYLTYLAIIVAIGSGNKKAIRDGMKGLNIITLAVMIILIRNAMLGSFAVFEWLIVFPMVFLGSVGLIGLYQWESLPVMGSFGIIYGVFCVLQPWLYWKRTYQGLKEECDPRWFIFAFFDLYNPTFIRFLKAMSIITCILGVMILALAVGALGYAIIKPTEELKEKDEEAAAEREAAWEEEGVSKKTRALFRGFNAACMSAFGIISIVFTEKILTGNNVDLSDASLESTSQLIPLLVGLFTFVSAAFGCFKG